MGGNALNKVISSRINLDKYIKVKKDLEEKIGKYLEFEFTIDVPGKVDFGDIDILYKLKNSFDNNFDNNICNKKNFNIEELLQQIYNPVEIVLNGPVCSFAYHLENSSSYEYFQVDLILVEDLQMSRFYFSYGDLGGIIGRLTQHKCLTYGSKGLWVSPNQETITKFLSEYKINLLVGYESTIQIMQITNAILPKIMLTNEPDKICEYLGLDFKIWLNGFESKKQIFEWIKKSPWFELDSFRALDYEHRHRANARPMYMEFLNYIFIDEKNFDIEKGNSTKYINKNLQLETIEYFDKIGMLIKHIKQIEMNLIRKEKFSGKKFLNLGIEPKQIKMYLDNFNKYIYNKFQMEFNDWLDANSSELIDTTIDIFLKKN